MSDFRPRLKGNKKKAFLNLTKEESRVLVIGDLHEPFCLDGYLKFCKDTYQKYNCNRVVFIGDVIDSHHTSFHEIDPDGLGGGDELDLAIRKLSKWYKAFPKAEVTSGNHDRIVYRKAKTGGIPKKWLKSYSEVLEVPNWNFVNDVYIDGVRYSHGEGGEARTKCVKEMISTVQGHLHTKCYTFWGIGRRIKVFGMQVGCGIDWAKYPFEYAKAGTKPAIACGVIVGGHLPFNVLMDL